MKILYFLSRKLGQSWDIRRELSKINYHIQTDAIQKHMTPQYALPSKHQSLIYASEADLLNKVLFDMKQNGICNTPKPQEILGTPLQICN